MALNSELDRQCKSCDYYGTTYLNKNWVKIGCLLGYKLDFRIRYCLKYRPNYETMYHLLKKEGLEIEDILEIMEREGY